MADHIVEILLIVSVVYVDDQTAAGSMAMVPYPRPRSKGRTLRREKVLPLSWLKYSL